MLSLPCQDKLGVPDCTEARDVTPQAPVNRPPHPTPDLVGPDPPCVDVRWRRVYVRCGRGRI